MKEQLKAELKQQFEGQKDQIIMDARTELALEKEKWLKERSELKNFYEQQADNKAAQGPTFKQQLQLEIKTQKELNGYLTNRLRDL